MSDRVKNKIALVTGAASRPSIGFATAKRLAQEGAEIFITDINFNELQKSQALIAETGAKVLALKHDVTSEKDWDRVFEVIKDTSKTLDILVNNAGVALLGEMGTQTTPNFNKQIEINTNSVYYGMKRAAALMKDTRGGSIINMSSVCGIIGLPGTLAYSAAKGAVRMMTKVAALETARDNIRVNSVHPGVIATNMQNDALRRNPNFYDEIAASIPNGRYGLPEDVANLILFLASDEASYITGSEFVIDGGMTAQ